MNRLFSYFSDYFIGIPKPTAENLFLLILSILVLDSFRSVRFAYRLLISKVTSTSLNAFYYTLKTDSVEHRAWNGVSGRKALSVIPQQLNSQPLLLSIDDTLIEKFGKKFEHSSKLFDHAAHNGSNYLNGHCMVSLLLSFPVLEGETMEYRSIPLGYRLWDKSKTKLALAAEMVGQAMDVIGKEQEITVCFSVPLPRKGLPLTGSGAKRPGSALTRKNAFSICHWICMRSAGTSKSAIMRGKLSGPLKITVCGAAVPLSVW